MAFLVIFGVFLLGFMVFLLAFLPSRGVFFYLPSYFFFSKFNSFRILKDVFFLCQAFFFKN